MTYCCFGDYYLEVEFRCPCQRCYWTNCDDALLGPKNWGNSGVILQNCYEIQILDSFGLKYPPTLPAPDVETILGGCDPTTARPVQYGEICGALYTKVVPKPDPVSNKSPVKASKNALGSYPPVPDGAWNELKIWFMSARYDGRAVAKKATFKAELTGIVILDRVGITEKTSGGRNAPGYFGRVPDNRYGLGYLMDQGPLVLQEHDSRVEFRNIAIDVGWKPESGGAFDEKWQQPG